MFFFFFCTGSFLGQKKLNDDLKSTQKWFSSGQSLGLNHDEMSGLRKAQINQMPRLKKYEDFHLNETAAIRREQQIDVDGTLNVATV